MALTDDGILAVPGLASRWVRLPTGAKAHYVTAGESGANVVLLHGGIAGSSGTAGWRFMAPVLAEAGFRVYCPDMPGFGLTTDPEDAYIHAGGHIDFLQDFANALALDKFHLAGNSLGASNTANYVTNHPERILSYALIASRIEGLLSPEVVAAADSRPIEQRPRTDIFDGTPQSMKKMMEAIIFRPDAVTDDLLEMRTASANRNLDYLNRRNRNRLNGDPNMQARMSIVGRFDSVTLPAIYLFGRNDVLIPFAVAQLQEDALPNVQVFYPDDCGHQGQTDRPELFNRVFLEFFRDGKVSRKTADWAGVSRRRPELATIVEQE